MDSGLLIFEWLSGSTILKNLLPDPLGDQASRLWSFDFVLVFDFCGLFYFRTANILSDGFQAEILRDSRHMVRFIRKG